MIEHFINLLEFLLLKDIIIMSYKYIKSITLVINILTNTFKD